jgi:hypothetical protein
MTRYELAVCPGCGRRNAIRRRDGSVTTCEPARSGQPEGVTRDSDSAAQSRLVSRR